MKFTKIGFERIKGITDLCPLQREPLLKYLSNRPKIFLPCKILRRELFFPSRSILFRHKKIMFYPPIFSKSFYNRHQVIRVLTNIIHISGVITVDFPSNDSYRHKNVSPILYFDGIFLL